MERSYCGGPVYLQVDLRHGNTQQLEDHHLLVFAHFHPHADDGLAIGDFVPRETFRAHQQTDSNAAGEWIGARLVASADQTTWLFEVNPSGRWFYQWESGATKAQRSTEHIFEVYVLFHEPGSNECQVVASACSPCFQMISFRRASSSSSAEKKPPRSSSTSIGIGIGTRASAVPQVPRPSLCEESTSHDDKADTEPVPVAPEADDSSSSPDSVDRNSVDSAVAFSAADVDVADETQSLAPFSSRSSPPENYVWTAPLDKELPDPNDEDRNRGHTPVSLLPSPETVAIAHQLGSLLDLVQWLPSTVLALVTPQMHSLVLAPFVHRRHHQVGDDYMYVNAAVLGSFISPPASPQAPPPGLNPVVVTRVLQLALWVLFDPNCARTSEEWLEQASTGLLDKAILFESYFSWLTDFSQRIDTYLATEMVATHQLRSCTTVSTLAHAASEMQIATTAAICAEIPGCRGVESFVAQAREVFLATSGLSSSSTTARAAKRSREASTIETAPDQCLGSFLGSWVADLTSLAWHTVAGTGTRQPPPPSAFVMMWAWRQLLGFELTSAAPQTTLAVTSLWNPSRGHNRRCSRLVLDGKPRWLRVFPSGESTESVVLGTQRLGHYVASFRRETRELLANSYTWPVTRGLDETTCYCVRLRLSLAGSDGDGDGDSNSNGTMPMTLSVCIAVERGVLRPGVDVATLDESPLQVKLQAVDQWTTLYSLQYKCYRQQQST